MLISVIRPAELGSSEMQAWHSMQLKTNSLVNPFLCPEFSLGVGRVQSAARVAVSTQRLGDPWVLSIRATAARRRRGDGCWPEQLSRADSCPRRGMGCAGAAQGMQAIDLAVQQAGPGPEAFPALCCRPVLSAVIDLSDGFKAYQGKLPAQGLPGFLKGLNRSMRSFQREIPGNARFVGDSRDTGELRTFMSWKSDQCRQNGWLDIFARSWVVDLIDYLFATRNESFSCSLSMLYAGETPVASAFHFRSGRCLVGWHCAYNPKVAKYSPGSIRHILEVEQQAAAGVQIYELGDESYQERFKNSDIYFARGTTYCRTVRGRRPSYPGALG